MAEPFSRPRKDGSLAWYGRVKLHTGEWDTPRLRGVKDKSSARKLNHELQAAEDRLAHGLGGGALFSGTFAELCDFAWDRHLKALAGATDDASRLHTHGGAVADRDGPGPSPLGPLPARLVTSSRLEEYFATLASTPSPRSGKPLSPLTINRIRATFATVFEVAARFGRWPKGANPARDTLQRHADKKPIRALPVEAMLPVIENAGDYWDGPFAVCLLAGLRRSEMLGARKEDVDLERRIIVVRRSGSRDTTKGNRHDALPIHEALMPYLAKWMRSPGAWLFPDREGNQRTVNQRFDLRLQSALVRAGFVDHYEHRCRRSSCSLRAPGKRGGHVEQHQDDAPRRCPACSMKLHITPKAPKVGFHVTRHTFATAALKSGASLQSVQKLMRHSDPRLTTEIYGHLDTGHLASELGRVVLRGVAAPAQHERAVAKIANKGDWTTCSRIDQSDTPREFAAPLRRDHEDADPSDIPNAEPSMKRAVGFVEPTGIEPVTYALRMHDSAGDDRRQALQTLASASDFSRASSVSASQGTAAKGSLSLGFAAPVRRGKQAASQTRNAGRGMPEQGSEPSSVARQEADGVVLTVSEVAARLRVSLKWVRDRITAGELEPTRLGGTRLGVTGAALDAYLRRALR